MAIELYQRQVGLEGGSGNVRVDPRLAPTSALTAIGEAGQQVADFAQQQAAAGWERRNVAYVSEQRARIAREVTTHRIEAERTAGEGAPGFVPAQDAWLQQFRETALAEAQAQVDAGAINGDALTLLGSTFDQVSESQFAWAAGFQDRAETAQLEARFSRTMDQYAATVALDPASLPRVRADFDTALAAASATWMRPETQTAVRAEFRQLTAEAALTAVARTNPQAVINLTQGGGSGPAGAAYEDWLIGRESTGVVSVINEQGYAGLGQWGESALASIGVYGNDPTVRNRGEGAEWDWRGQFSIPGFPQVRTIEDFTTGPDAEAAQRAVLARWTADQRDTIAERGWLATYGGQTIGGVTITEAALMAGMHLGGEGGVAAFLASNGAEDAADANGTRISDYMREASALRLETEALPMATPTGATGGYTVDPGDGGPPVTMYAAGAGVEVLVQAGPQAVGRAVTVAEQQLREQQAQAQGVVGPQVEAEMALLGAGIRPPPGQTAGDAEIRAAYPGAQGGELVLARAQAYELVDQANRLRYATPESQAAIVAEWAARAEDPALPIADRADALRVAQALAESRAEIVAARDADPVGFIMADSPQLAAQFQAAIESGDAGALRQPMQAAAALQRGWGAAVPVLLPAQFTERWLANWDGGTPDARVAQLAQLTNAAGSDRQLVLAELARARPEIAHAGGLLVAGSAPATLNDLVGGQAVAAGDRLKPPPSVRNAGIAAVLGGAFGHNSATYSQVVGAAEAIYHSRALRQGLAPDDFSAQGETWERALQEAAGAVFDAEGRQRGGLVEHNGLPTVLPASIGADDFAGLIESVGPAAIAAAGVNGVLPHHANGDPFTADELAGAYLVAIDDGQYRVAMEDPRGAEPGWIQGDGDNGFFILDVRRFQELQALPAFVPPGAP